MGILLNASNYAIIQTTTAGLDSTNAYKSLRGEANGSQPIFSDTPALFANDYMEPAHYHPLPPDGRVTVLAGNDNKTPGAYDEENNFKSDMYACYYNLIRWVRDGNAAALTAAKDIANYYTTSTADPVFKLGDSDGDNVVEPGNAEGDDYSLTMSNEASWALLIWCQIADILKNPPANRAAAAGWGSTQRARMDSFLSKLQQQIAASELGATNIPNNTNIAAHAARMAYCAYLGQVGGTWWNDSLSKLKTFMSTIISASSTPQLNGKVKEIESRDCTHPQYSIMAYLYAAQIEKNHVVAPGNETLFLYNPSNPSNASKANSRLLLGIEWLAKRFVTTAGESYYTSEAQIDSSNGCRDCRPNALNQKNPRFRDGQYQIAKNYYGEALIPRMKAAYEQETFTYTGFKDGNGNPDTRARPFRSENFPDIFRVTHGGSF